MNKKRQIQRANPAKAVQRYQPGTRIHVVKHFSPIQNRENDNNLPEVDCHVDKNHIVEVLQAPVNASFQKNKTQKLRSRSLDSQSVKKPQNKIVNNGVKEFVAKTTSVNSAPNSLVESEKKKNHSRKSLSETSSGIFEDFTKFAVHLKRKPKAPVQIQTLFAPRLKINATTITSHQQKNGESANRPSNVRDEDYVKALKQEILMNKEKIKGCKPQIFAENRNANKPQNGGFVKNELKPRKGKAKEFKPQSLPIAKSVNSYNNSRIKQLKDEIVRARATKIAKNKEFVTNLKKEIADFRKIERHLGINGIKKPDNASCRSSSSVNEETIESCKSKDSDVSKVITKKISCNAEFQDKSYNHFSTIVSHVESTCPIPPEDIGDHIGKEGNKKKIINAVIKDPNELAALVQNYTKDNCVPIVFVTMNNSKPSTDADNLSESVVNTPNSENVEGGNPEQNTMQTGEVSTGHERSPSSSEKIACIDKESGSSLTSISGLSGPKLADIPTSEKGDTSSKKSARSTGSEDGCGCSSISSNISETNKLIDRVQDTLKEARTNKSKCSKPYTKITTASSATPTTDTSTDEARPQTRRNTDSRYFDTAPETASDIVVASDKYKSSPDEISGEQEIKVERLNSMDYMQTKLNTISELTESDVSSLQTSSEKKNPATPESNDVKDGSRCTCSPQSCKKVYVKPAKNLCCLEQKDVQEQVPISTEKVIQNHLNDKIPKCQKLCVQKMPPINIRPALTIQKTLNISILPDGDTINNLNERTKNVGYTVVNKTSMKLPSTDSMITNYEEIEDNPEDEEDFVSFAQARGRFSSLAHIDGKYIRSPSRHLDVEMVFDNREKVGGVDSATNLSTGGVLMTPYKILGRSTVEDDLEKREKSILILKSARNFQTTNEDSEGNIVVASDDIEKLERATLRSVMLCNKDLEAINTSMRSGNKNHKNQEAIKQPAESSKKNEDFLQDAERGIRETRSDSEVKINKLIKRLLSCDQDLDTQEGDDKSNEIDDTEAVNICPNEQGSYCCRNSKEELSADSSANINKRISKHSCAAINIGSIEDRTDGITKCTCDGDSFLENIGTKDVIMYKGCFAYSCDCKQDAFVSLTEIMTNSTRDSDNQESVAVICENSIPVSLVPESSVNYKVSQTLLHATEVVRTGTDNSSAIESISEDEAGNLKEAVHLTDKLAKGYCCVGTENTQENFRLNESIRKVVVEPANLLENSKVSGNIDTGNANKNSLFKDSTKRIQEPAVSLETENNFGNCTDSTCCCDVRGNIENTEENSRFKDTIRKIEDPAIAHEVQGNTEDFRNCKLTSDKTCICNANGNFADTRTYKMPAVNNWENKGAFDDNRSKINDQSQGGGLYSFRSSSYKAKEIDETETEMKSTIEEDSRNSYYKATDQDWRTSMGFNFKDCCEKIKRELRKKLNLDPASSEENFCRMIGSLNKDCCLKRTEQPRNNVEVIEESFLDSRKNNEISMTLDKKEIEEEGSNKRHEASISSVIEEIKKPKKTRISEESAENERNKISTMTSNLTPSENFFGRKTSVSFMKGAALATFQQKPRCQNVTGKCTKSEDVQACTHQKEAETNVKTLEIIPTNDQEVSAVLETPPHKSFCFCGKEFSESQLLNISTHIDKTVMVCFQTTSTRDIANAYNENELKVHRTVSNGRLSEHSGKSVTFPRPPVACGNNIVETTDIKDVENLEDSRENSSVMTDENDEAKDVFYQSYQLLDHHGKLDPGDLDSLETESKKESINEEVYRTFINPDGIKSGPSRDVISMKSVKSRTMGSVYSRKSLVEKVMSNLEYLKTRNIQKGRQSHADAKRGYFSNQIGSSYSASSRPTNDKNMPCSRASPRVNPVPIHINSDSVINDKRKISPFDIGFYVSVATQCSGESLKRMSRCCIQALPKNDSSGKTVRSQQTFAKSMICTSVQDTCTRKEKEVATVTKAVETFEKEVETVPPKIEKEEPSRIKTCCQGEMPAKPMEILEIVDAAPALHAYDSPSSITISYTTEESVTEEEVEEVETFLGHTDLDQPSVTKLDDVRLIKHPSTVETEKDRKITFEHIGAAKTNQPREFEPLMSYNAILNNMKKDGVQVNMKDTSSDKDKRWKCFKCLSRKSNKKSKYRSSPEPITYTAKNRTSVGQRKVSYYYEGRRGDDARSSSDRSGSDTMPSFLSELTAASKAEIESFHQKLGTEHVENDYIEKIRKTASSKQLGEEITRKTISNTRLVRVPSKSRDTVTTIYPVQVQGDSNYFSAINHDNPLRDLIYPEQDNLTLPKASNGRYKDEEDLFCPPAYPIYEEIPVRRRIGRYIPKMKLQLPLANRLSDIESSYRESLSDGEINCCTSISNGEIHQCPKSSVRRRSKSRDKRRKRSSSFSSTDKKIESPIKIKKHDSYFDNWVTYYVTNNANIFDSSSTSKSSK